MPNTFLGCQDPLADLKEGRQKSEESKEVYRLLPIIIYANCRDISFFLIENEINTSKR